MRRALCCGNTTIQKMGLFPTTSLTSPLGIRRRALNLMLLMTAITKIGHMVDITSQVEEKVDSRLEICGVIRSFLMKNRRSSYEYLSSSSALLKLVKSVINARLASLCHTVRKCCA